MGDMISAANEYRKQKEFATSGSSDVSADDETPIKGVLGMAAGGFFAVLIFMLGLYIYSIMLASRTGSTAILAMAIILPWVIPVPLLIPIIMIVVSKNYKKPAAFGYY